MKDPHTKFFESLEPINPILSLHPHLEKFDYKLQTINYKEVKFQFLA